MGVPGGSAAKRLVLESVGWILVVGGVAALVLPGPGLLMLVGGLALLSQQYDWAERRLDPIRLRALRGAAEGVETWPRIVLSVLGALVAMAFGGLWIWSPEAPSWWPVDDDWWLFGGPWTGATLVFSGILALVLIGYSYRRFHGRPEALEQLEQEIEDAARAAEQRQHDRG